MAKKNLTLIITGSVAACRTELLCQELMKDYKLSIIYTKAAEFFINRYQLLTTLGVDNLYGAEFSLKEAGMISHVNLAKKTDLTIVAPASYNFINKINCGIADDFATSYLSVIDKNKLLLCPAMNTAMYKQAVLQNSLQNLTQLGTVVTGPISGQLASGEVDLGHMQDLVVIKRLIAEMI